MKLKKIRKLLDELQDNAKRGVPHSLTFKPTGKLTKAQVKELQDSLNYSFRNWSESWIHPWIEMIRTEVNQGILKKGEER